MTLNIGQNKPDGGNRIGNPSGENASKSKRTAKDSVFCDLFGDPKYLFQLYQSLHPEDVGATEQDLGNVTIQNVMMEQPYNDLGFTVGDRLLVLLEAQSTWSENILIRILMYLASTWKEYIVGHHLDLYGSGKVSLPKPELYVIYTGNRQTRPEWITLRDEFFPEQECFVDVKVRMLYGVPDGQNIIDQYVAFTKVHDEQVREFGRSRDAVLETIRICKKKNILKEYLEGREKEVVNIMMTLFDQEYANQILMERGRAEGEKRGRAEGETSAKREAAFSLVRRGFSAEDIADIVNVSAQTVQEWLSGADLVK